MQNSKTSVATCSRRKAKMHQYLRDARMHARPHVNGMPTAAVKLRRWVPDTGMRTDVHCLCSCTCPHQAPYSLRAGHACMRGIRCMQRHKTPNHDSAGDATRRRRCRCR